MTLQRTYDLVPKIRNQMEKEETTIKPRWCPNDEKPKECPNDEKQVEQPNEIR